MMKDEQLEVKTEQNLNEEEMVNSISDSVKEQRGVTETDLKPIRCSNMTDPNKLGFYIVARIYQHGYVEIQTIGPKALSKAMLAIMRANCIVARYSSSVKLVAIPNVRKVFIDDQQTGTRQERTALLTRIIPVPISVMR